MHIAYGYTGEGKKPVKGGGVTYAPGARKKFEAFLQDAADALHEMPFYRWLRERRLYIIPAIEVWNPRKLKIRPRQARDAPRQATGGARRAQFYPR